MPRLCSCHEIEDGNAPGQAKEAAEAARREQADVEDARIALEEAESWLLSAKNGAARPCAALAPPAAIVGRGALLSPAAAAAPVRRQGARGSGASGGGGRRRFHFCAARFDRDLPMPRLSLSIN
jgi:hypothetical protein